MPLPERISVKRRRSQEPVDTLYLEHGTVPDRKRRVTDFYFQRLSHDPIAPISSRNAPSVPLDPPKTSADGIPAIRPTAPGDDKKDFERLRRNLEANEAAGRVVIKPETPADITSQSAPTTPVSKAKLESARRFHLARHLAPGLGLGPNSSGSIRKQKLSIRPPLATFVERLGVKFRHEENPLYGGTPVDKILDVAPGGASAEPKESDVKALQAAQRHATSTFLQNVPNSVREGHSIKDHPSTWDHESDQLADELAALAMELDPEAKERQERQEREDPPASIPVSKDTEMSFRDREEDYIYETYVRVRYDDETERLLDLPDANIGLLVIDEEDEDLWQRYVNSDDDTDWDDEDSNAEDNPANDYPEDELSSDDEFGFNPYKHRQHASEDEAFDEDDFDKIDSNRW
ncbi:hypothetical protein PV08_05234 [Exophiala spinifera]|uniref:Transcription factor Iwr1 domain-containing protein n=1 Tax=Exophiala spinifera TaxID=91928 RepID=A0A0D2BVA0_9EURO|nr:uncharacterized protein PV08_05234 [Exophiala spinifera]KIW15189.1 hypothetical protein PV08_05234 [Exophiala spinifera]